MERIWIYQADRELNEQEKEHVLAKLDQFISQWHAHGKQLAAWAEVRYGYFIIIAVNEAVALPTGCSIDKSVHLLKELEQELQVSLFDRMQIAYRDGERIRIAPRPVFEKLIAGGEVNRDTIVFNNLIQYSPDLQSEWEVPLSKSWHARVFTV